MEILNFVTRYKILRWVYFVNKLRQLRGVRFLWAENQSINLNWHPQYVAHDKMLKDLNCHTEGEYGTSDLSTVLGSDDNFRIS